MSPVVGRCLDCPTRLPLVSGPGRPRLRCEPCAEARRRQLVAINVMRHRERTHTLLWDFRIHLGAADSNTAKVADALDSGNWVLVEDDGSHTPLDPEVMTFLDEYRGTYPAVWESQTVQDAIRRARARREADEVRREVRANYRLQGVLAPVVTDDAAVSG